MKKYLRNASLFIIAIVLGFGFNLNAFAAGACGDLNNNECRIGERGPIIVAGNGEKYRQLNSATPNTRDKVSGTGETNKKGQPWNYYETVGVNDTSADTGFSSYQDSKSVLFCLDPQYKGQSDLHASRFLLDKTEGPLVQTYDAAVMSVLLEGGITRSVSDIKTYFAKSLAIRALSYTYGVFNDNDTAYDNAFFASMTVAYNWNQFYAADLAALNTALGELGVSNIGGRVEFHKGYNYTGDVVNQSAGYYTRALAAATKYAKALKNTAKVEAASPVAGEVETSGSEDNQFVQKDVVHTIKISGFTNDNKFVINSNDSYGIKFADGMQYDGLTAYVSKIEVNGNVIANSKEAVAGLLGKDLVELGYIPENQNVEVKITAHFEGYKTSTNPSVQILKCGQQPIKYSIDGTYGSDQTDEFSNYVATIWYIKKSKMQRYVGIEQKTAENGDEGTPWESKYETYLIDACSCDDLIAACVVTMNPNSPECIELKESNCGECAWLEAACKMGDQSACDRHDAVCDLSCDTYVETFECCDDAGDLIVSTLDDHEVKILGPGKDNPDASSVKACFVSKLDQLAELQGDGTYKNNTNIEIKDQKGNSYALADRKSNEYCTVSCKEDYIMTMPTAKLVNAGRYFTFKARVEGTKLCYTNTIDREKYNKDMEKAQIRLIEAWNNFKYWEKADQSSREESTSCCSTCSGCNEYIAYHFVSNTAEKYDYTIIGNGIIRKQKTTQNVYETSPIHNYCTGNEHCTYCGDCDEDSSDSCCPWEEWDVQPDPTSFDTLGSLNSWISSNLSAARDELALAMAAYPLIIKEYRECVTWDTEINYDPEVYYDYVEDYMNMLNNRMGQMDKDISGISNSEWYCNSNINASNNSEIGGAATIQDSNYDYCTKSSSSSNTDTTLQYVFCNESDCIYDPTAVSNARYKKTTSKVTGNYKPSTLFYNVYPSGEITVNKSDNNVALENKLPVALNRPRGIYKYTVNIENLGEFYDQAPKSNLGRYVGSNTAIVDPKTLIYNCAYLVNITTTNGWLCDFDDTCTDDCISNCIGPNCDGYCDGIDCVADCIGLGCIYDSSAGTSLIERLVSLNGLFPKGTDSYNWDASRNDKASSTISAIEEKGNKAYEEKPILSITISPSAANEIRRYNNSVIDDGGYSNATVSCRDRNGVEQIACYSDVLTDILDGKFGDIVSDESLIADDNYRFGENSEYFKLWNGRISEEDMIGPAWK